jgi:hypothetical protein
VEDDLNDGMRPEPLEGEIEGPGSRGAAVRILILSRGGVKAHLDLPVRVLTKVRIRFPLNGEMLESQAVCLNTTPEEPWVSTFLFLNAPSTQRMKIEQLLGRRVGMRLPAG